MIYDLSNTSDLNDFKIEANRLLYFKQEVELKAIKITRSIKQNRSLHKFFMMLSDELNNLGIEYQYIGISGRQFSLMYTLDLVKQFIWKPIQVALFDFESTTKLDTIQMNQIIDVITKFFADRGVVITFPSMDSLIDNDEKM